MTAQDSTTSPQPPGFTPVKTLHRSENDRYLAGVAGGLGRYAGVDPLLFRVLFVVLTVFGGSGLLLYALGWLLIPAEGQTESEGQRLLRGTGSTFAKVVGIIALVIGLVAVAAVVDTGPGLGGIGVIAVVAVLALLLMRNGQRPAAPAEPVMPVVPVEPPAPPGEYGQTTGTAYAGTPPAYTPPVAPPPPPPTAPRERSPLGRITVSVALIAVGLMVGWNVVAENDFKAVSVFATALGVVALGLLVGAVVGRARGLIALGLVLAVATAIAAAADRGLPGGVGERRWAPVTATAAEREFQLGVGDAELDLTELPPGSDVDVEVRLGVGELRVIVPADARVVARGEVGAGALEFFDEPDQDGTDLSDSTVLEPAGTASGTTITLDASVGLGNLEVTR